MKLRDKVATRLSNGSQALGISLNESQIDLYLGYIQLLIDWNKYFNLTAIRRADEIVKTHLLDSLAILPNMVGEKWLDVGSGAGLPGLVLAIAAPERNIVLLDSNLKKTRFLNHVVYSLKLPNVTVLRSRIEDLDAKCTFDTIVSRATFDVPKFCQLSWKYVASNGCLLAMLGRLQPRSETNLDKLMIEQVIEQAQFINQDGANSVDIGTEHSLVAQLVGNLSPFANRRLASIIRLKSVNPEVDRHALIMYKGNTL